MEQLDINYGQGMMLLPITVDHTIDERSPLWGHSHDSLLVRDFLRCCQRITLLYLEQLCFKTNAVWALLIPCRYISAPVAANALDGFIYTTRVASQTSTPLCCTHAWQTTVELVATAPAQALGAEIVVVFEGTSEFGHQFSTRQSYLPREIHWGYQFVQIVHPADPGSTQHIVDISRWALQSDIGV